MEFDISKHGDNLEREYCAFIKTYLPSYEQIWERYIGNDGTNKMIDIPNLTGDEKKDREFFSQYHYTILESSACLQLLLDQLTSFRVNSERRVSSLLELNNLIISFWGHIGRIRDNISKILNIFNLSSLMSDIEKFYQTRNQILHDRKFPYYIVDGEILIPPIEDGSEKSYGWHTSKSWFEMDTSNYNIMADFHNELYGEYINLVNSILFKVLPKIKEICERKNISIVPLNGIDYGTNTDSSGSADWTFRIIKED